MYINPIQVLSFMRLDVFVKGQAVIAISLNDISANLTHNVSTIREVSIDA